MLCGAELHCIEISFSFSYDDTCGKMVIIKHLNDHDDLYCNNSDNLNNSFDYNNDSLTITTILIIRIIVVIMIMIIIMTITIKKI